MIFKSFDLMLSWLTIAKKVAHGILTKMYVESGEVEGC